MERLTCYESILYQLLLLNFSKDAIYRAVERGLEERTISDGRMTYNIKGVSRKHQLTYLTITPIGIEYLKQKCSHKRSTAKTDTVSSVECFIRSSL